MSFQMDIQVAFKENVVSSPTWEHNHILLKSNLLQQLSGSFAKSTKSRSSLRDGEKASLYQVWICSSLYHSGNKTSMRAFPSSSVTDDAWKLAGNTIYDAHQ